MGEAKLIACLTKRGLKPPLPSNQAPLGKVRGFTQDVPRER